MSANILVIFILKMGLIGAFSIQFIDETAKKKGKCLVIWLFCSLLAQNASFKGSLMTLIRPELTTDIVFQTLSASKVQRRYKYPFSWGVKGYIRTNVSGCSKAVPSPIHEESPFS